MTTIQIVKNSDRCHVSVNGSPVRTFIYADYNESKLENKAAHAVHDAMAQCFLTLQDRQAGGAEVSINTEIITK